MTSDIKVWTFVWDIIQTLIIAVIAIYTWIVNRSKVNKQAIDRVDQKATRIQQRVDLIENDLRHMPTHEDLGKVYEKLNAVDGTLKEVKGEMTHMNKTLALLNEYLLKDKDR